VAPPIKGQVLAGRRVHTSKTWTTLDRQNCRLCEGLVARWVGKGGDIETNSEVDWSGGFGEWVYTRGFDGERSETFSTVAHT